MYESTLQKGDATIPSCSQLLDIAAGGKVVAVVREKQIELWDTATTKKLKAAPFQHTRIDAASFSPDGQLLALSDRNELVLWRWEENTHERIDLGRRVGSLTFSPDGKFLAEGPTPGENIQIRDVETRKVVQTLANGAKLDDERPANGLLARRAGANRVRQQHVRARDGRAAPHQPVGHGGRFPGPPTPDSGRVAANLRRVAERAHTSSRCSKTATA